MDLLSGMRHLPSSNGFGTAKSSRSIRATSVSETTPIPSSAISFTRHISFAIAPTPSSGFSLPIANGLPTALHALVVRCARQML
jgi:hypothetical protein